VGGTTGETITRVQQTIMTRMGEKYLMLVQSLTIVRMRAGTQKGGMGKTST
jgi:hypothetical protein